MEGGCGENDGIVVVGRRLTLLDQMSTVQGRRDALAGLTLDAILSDKRAALLPPPLPAPPPPPASRTLLDIIREEETGGKNFGHKDRRSWKLLRDKLRLKRAGAAWTSSVRIPASDINIQSGNARNPSSQLLRRSSVRFQTNPAGEGIAQQGETVGNTNSRPQFTRRTSVRVASLALVQTESTQPENNSADIPMPQDATPANSIRHQLGRRNSTRIPQSNLEMEDNYDDPFEVAREGTRRLAVALAEERALSAREAVAAQEAAEAEAARAEAAAAEAEESGSAETEDAAAPRELPPPEPAPVDPQSRMSLMDLLEETDRQMGVEGSKYMVADDDDDVEEDDGGGGGGGIEYNCCVCMVRHKGAAFIPCGHTFCRLCSRELWVQRGNCPLCNNFILEILDIF